MILNDVKSSSQCGKCNKVGSHQLTLDCHHQICNRCLSYQICHFEQQPQLTEFLEVTCQKCNEITELSIPLVYKIIKKHTLAQKNQKQLLCLTCLDGVFNVKDFVGGRHEKHQVKDTFNAAKILAHILGDYGSGLKKKLDQFYKEKIKLIQSQKVINYGLEQNLYRLKQSFEKMREGIDQKEKQITIKMKQMYQQQFSYLSNEIKNTSGQIFKTKSLNQWIEKNVMYNFDFLGEYKIQQIINFSVKNKSQINSLLQFKEKSKEIGKRVQKTTEMIDLMIPFEDLNIKLSQIRNIEMRVQKSDGYQRQYASKNKINNNYFKDKKSEILNTTNTFKEKDTFYSSKNYSTLSTKLMYLHQSMRLE